MRIPCPVCGERDRREFTYRGADLDRPAGEHAADWGPEWHRHLHLRENPAGWAREMWHHGAGCGAWLSVERHTVTHEVRASALAGEAR